MKRLIEQIEALDGTKVQMHHDVGYVIDPRSAIFEMDLLWELAGQNGAVRQEFHTRIPSRKGLVQGPVLFNLDDEIRRQARLN